MIGSEKGPCHEALCKKTDADEGIEHSIHSAICQNLAAEACYSAKTHHRQGHIGLGVLRRCRWPFRRF